MAWRRAHFAYFLASLMACASPTMMANASEPTDSWWVKTRNQAGSLWENARDWWRDDPSSSNHFQQVWDGLLPKLDRTLVLEDRQSDLPEKAWFSTDQSDNQAAINALLDEAITILVMSPAQHYRQRIRELEQTITAAQEEIAELRTKRVSAPQEAHWHKTAADYERAIDEQNRRITQADKELRDLRREFAEDLRHLGLELSDEQLEFLLSTVVGDDLIEMGIAFDNVKILTEQLQQLMADSREDLASSRRYYGMYLILLEMLERMQGHLIAAVKTRYVPEIDVIVGKTQALMAETRALRQRTQQDRRVLNANLEAQELTLRAAALYKDYLNEQAQQVAAARERLNHDIAIARNTYETVKLSGELVALMNSSQQLLDNLLQRQLPPLRAFENLEMKREFERLTARIKAQSAG